MALFIEAEDVKWLDPRTIDWVLLTQTNLISDKCCQVGMRYYSWE